MNRKQFILGIYDTTRDTITELKELQAHIDETLRKIEDPQYSIAHKESKLRPLLSEFKIQQIKLQEDAVLKVRKLVDEYVDFVAQSEILDPAKMTDDVALLNTGIKLPQSDLEQLFDKNSGNSTMERLICSYAEQHGIPIRRHFTDRVLETKRTLQDVPEGVKIVLKNFDSPAAYTALLGEKSALYSIYAAEVGEA